MATKPVSCILKDKPFDDVVSAILNKDTQAILEAGLTPMQEERAVYIHSF